MVKVIYSMRLRFAAMSYGMYDYYAHFLSPETTIDAQPCIGMVIDDFDVKGILYNSETDIYTLESSYVTTHGIRYHNALMEYTNKGWVQVSGLGLRVFESSVPQWLTDGRPDKIKLR